MSLLKLNVKDRLPKRVRVYDYQLETLLIAYYREIRYYFCERLILYESYSNNFFCCKVHVLFSVIICFFFLLRRQRIKAKEAEYAISGGSASSTYGQGWEMKEDSVYATISDVDRYRTGCVNPAVSQELDLNTSTCFTDRFIGQEEECQTMSSNHGNPASTAPKHESVCQNEAEDERSDIAVIDVHQSFEADSGVEQHIEGCLPTCEYAMVDKQDGGLRMCTSCNITRPPRRRDTNRNRGYDNNVGVKSKTKMS